MEREYAREQKLPPSEVEVLDALKKSPIRRNWRAKQLFDAGWTLQAIGDAFTPSIRRSTVQYWVKNAYYPVTAVEDPVPSPWGGFVDAPNPKPPVGYQRKTPISPGISSEDQLRLRKLAPLARLYRSGMASTSPPAVANDEYNALIQSLYNKNVKIAEIAHAANVTNRAIARRLGK